jgi:uncharacterized membrane protein YfcA
LLILTLYLIAGSFVGLLAGILGIGGGVFIVPILATMFNHFNITPPEITMHIAIATSLGIMILTTQAVVRAHVHIGQVLWEVVYRLLPGTLIGGAFGVLCTDQLKSNTLKMIFAAFVMAIGLRMIIVRHPKILSGLPRNSWIFHSISSSIGFLSGLLGIGGGSLMIPFLTKCNTPIRQAQAVSSLCSFCVAVLGSSIAVASGFNEPVPSGSLGYVYLPAMLCVAIPSMVTAPLGTRIAYLLPVLTLKRLFGGFLIFSGIHMLMS